MNRRHFLRCAAGAAASLLLTSMTHHPQTNMNILVLTGSPRRHGNTNHLADRFIQGATERGHSVFRFDCAAHRIHGCLACNRCGMNGDCALHDDFDLVRPHLLNADLVVFVTPTYYFGFSSYLKNVIDRFYALNGRLKGAPKRTALLTACADSDPDTVAPMLQHYRALAAYLGWQDIGTVAALGVWTEGSVIHTPYSEAAYQLGHSLT